jgi:hypothetical protein
MLAIANIAKNRKEYCCQNCDYNTFNKYDYKKHCETIKHKNAILATHIDELAIEQSQKSQHEYKCKCGKNYKDNSGLWRHKKQCNTSVEITTELVLQLIKENKEIQKLFIEQSQSVQQQTTTLTNIVQDVVKNGANNNIITTNNTNTNTNTNSNNTTNNSFNLNLFLNETCKDAMNISDFVSSIKMNLDDLEHTGRQGYIEGISKIIINNLNNLEQCFRPLHCCDLKQKVLYIKDNNKWTKENDSKPILTKAIKIIANENIKQIKSWKEKYPDCDKSDSNKNDLYLKIVSNSMNGLTKEESDKNINKIISNVAKKLLLISTNKV